MVIDAPTRGPASPTPRKWRHVIANFGLALAACALAIFAAEVLIHVAGLAPAPGLFTVTAQEYARLPGIFGPNQRVTEGAGTRFVHSTQIDSLGYRGRDFPREKEVGEFRILYVGDSFTYGHNVADGETLPAQLEKQLSTACRRARVINAGLSGSTIIGQDAMALRGLALAPDVVVLMYHENDIDELMGPRIWSQLAENRRIKSRFPLSLVYRLLRRSALWNLAQDARRSVFLHPVKSGVRPREIQIPFEAIETARQEYGEHLAALADTLRKVDVPFVFALFPHPESVRSGLGGRDYDAIRTSAQRVGVSTVDLLETLRKAGVSVEEAFLLPDDYHPSARGYQIAATSLKDVVVRLAPLEACPVQ